MRLGLDEEIRVLPNGPPELHPSAFPLDSVADVDVTVPLSCAGFGHHADPDGWPVRAKCIAELLDCLGLGDRYE